MIDINNWINDFLQSLNNTFGDRVWFVGLQGSYGRGEATEASDIDMVVILDELSFSDIKDYDKMLNTLPHRDMVCGFISGRDEILNWDSADLFQFCYDTTAIKGSLDDVLKLVDEAAVSRAIKTGACNIYHACVHNMLHDKSEDILRALYKSSSFVMQAIAFKRTGTYVKHQDELIKIMSKDEQDIIKIYMGLKKGNEIDFEPMSEALFLWAKRWIA